MRLYIKNMVCNRCILVVRQELDKLQIPASDISLGEVSIPDQTDPALIHTLSENLSAVGFEVLDDARRQMIEKIKNIIIKQVHHSDGEQTLKLSAMISEALHKDYSYLSHLFSEVEGITIEKYLINQKIERVKELMIYDELSLSEISWKLGYSSVAHLSAQFKKVTGLTPTAFKTLGHQKRKALDQI